MSLVAGLDIGSVFVKAVILADGRFAGSAIVRSGRNYAATAAETLQQARRGLVDSGAIEFVAATGVGAAKVSGDKLTVSDVACQGKGIHYLFPEARLIIEIGGQASRVMKVDNKGRVVDFAIGERCATGSGRFLQIMSRVLQVEFEELGPLSLLAQKPVDFSTSCAVFTESEAISRISDGAPREDIIAGVHRAMAGKIISLVDRVGRQTAMALTGGGARDAGMVKMLETKLGLKLLLPPEPFITAALGAGAIANEELTRRATGGRL